MEWSGVEWSGLFLLVCVKRKSVLYMFFVDSISVCLCVCVCVCVFVYDFYVFNYCRVLVRVCRGLFGFVLFFIPYSFPSFDLGMYVSEIICLLSYFY